MMDKKRKKQTDAVRSYIEQMTAEKDPRKKNATALQVLDALYEKEDDLYVYVGEHGIS